MLLLFWYIRSSARIDLIILGYYTIFTKKCILTERFFLGHRPKAVLGLFNCNGFFCLNVQTVDIDKHL
jgi:hypothetical protein